MFPLLNNLIMSTARQPRLSSKPTPTLLAYRRYYQLLHHPSTEAFLGYRSLIAPVLAKGAAAPGKAPETSATVGGNANVPVPGLRPITPATASFASAFPPVTPRSPTAAFTIPPLNISALAPERPSSTPPSSSATTTPSPFISSQYALARSAPMTRLSLIFNPHSLSWPLRRALSPASPLASSAPATFAPTGAVSNGPGAGTAAPAVDRSTASASGATRSSLPSSSTPPDPPVATTLALPKARMRLLSSLARATKNHGEDHGGPRTAAPTVNTTSECGTGEVEAAPPRAPDLRETLARLSRARVALDHFVPDWVKK